MPRGGAVVRYEGRRGVVWRIKYVDAAGKQAMETIGAERDGVTRSNAEAELRERLVRVERKHYRRPKLITFADYSRLWLEEGQTRRAWKAGTVGPYRTCIRRLNDTFGSMPLGMVRPRHVAAYVAKLGKTYAASTIGRDLALLHDVFKTAKREELVDSNPVEGAERPKKPRRKWRILDPVEVTRVRAALSDEQARTLFLVLVIMGVRRSELQRLRWRDVDLVENILRVRDSKSEEGIRSIAIPPMLAEELWQHRRRTKFQGDEDLVFCHPETGTKYNPHTFAKQFRAALAEAGIHDYVRPFHDLRHTSITNEAAAGSSPIALMAKAGHRSMSTTNIYVHLAGVVFRDEAEALERRLLGVESSTHLSEPETISDDLPLDSMPVQGLTDRP